MGKKRIASFLLLSCAVAFAAFSEQKAWAKIGVPFLSETFDRTVPLTPGGSVAIENVNGSITIAGWDRDAVEIHAVKIAARTPSDLPLVRVEVAAGPGRVAVNTVNPAEDGAEVTVNYSLRVPRRVLLQEVATVNGELRVTGVDATGELRSVNGSIGVLDCDGGLSARTTNGDIQMEMDHLTAKGPLSVQTVNGEITLAVPNTTAANLDVRSMNGDFQSEMPVAYLGAFRPREIHGRLGGGGVTLQLRTVNGSIRISSLPHGV